jgi:transposase
MKKRGKRYSETFKKEAVQYVKDNDISASQAARNLNLNLTTLQRWVKQAQVDAGKGKKGELTSAERLEFRRMKRELRRLKMEAEILKKATAYFARDQW